MMRVTHDRDMASPALNEPIDCRHAVIKHLPPPQATHALMDLLVRPFVPLLLPLVKGL